MPFLLAEILNFQGSTHRIGVGSFSKFIVSDSNLLKACQDKDYRTMASLYNGSGNVDTYAPKIEAAYTTYKNA